MAHRNEPNQPAGRVGGWSDPRGFRRHRGVLRTAGRGFEVQWTTNLFSSNAWQALNTPANRPFFPATNDPGRVPDSLTNAAGRFYRVRAYEP